MCITVMKEWYQVLKECLAVLQVWQLDFCTNSFENEHLTYENITKVILFWGTGHQQPSTNDPKPDVFNINFPLDSPWKLI